MWGDTATLRVCAKFHCTLICKRHFSPLKHIEVQIWGGGEACPSSTNGGRKSLQIYFRIQG